MDRTIDRLVSKLPAGCVAAAIVGAMACGRAVAADAGPADKSAYTLLNPTPAGLLRDVSPDRPDNPESPYTVDAGHVQVEFSFGEWRKGGGAEELSLFPTNVKIGLTNNVDVQFVVNPYLRGRAGGNTDQGHGDSTIRLKVNLFGNDGGTAALALLPYVTFPTGADAFSNDDHVEGGIAIPLSVNLPGDFSLSVMAELDFVRDGGGGYDSSFLHSTSLSHAIVGDLGGYVEYVGVTPIDGGGKYAVTVGAGLTYQASPNVVFDAGAEVGLHGPADDLRVFAGMTWRI